MFTFYLCEYQTDGKIALDTILSLILCLLLLIRGKIGERAQVFDFSCSFYICFEMTNLCHFSFFLLFCLKPTFKTRKNREYFTKLHFLSFPLFIAGSCCSVEFSFFSFIVQLVIPIPLRKILL